MTTYCLNGLPQGRTVWLPQHDDDAFNIPRADVRRFVIDNLKLIGFRKVDKFALVDLVVTSANEGLAQ